jgi:UPF0271 protein
MIDLNCDMGEGMETDAVIFPFISSANIACGAHAGDVGTMRRTVELAIRYGVAVGAHPSYSDRARFGRVDVLGDPASEMDLDELKDSLFGQLRTLDEVCRGLGVQLHHVKPHGALYNRAARDGAVASAICRVVAELNPDLLLYGLSGSKMAAAAGEAGLRFVSEVFADRTYRADGSLTPRSEAEALIEDGAGVVAQVLTLVREGRVAIGRRAGADARVGDDSGGTTIAIRAETVCLHGDGAHAVEFARLIYEVLVADKIRIVAPVI